MEIETKEDFLTFWRELTKALRENKANYRRMEDKIRAIARKYGLDVYFINEGILTITFKKDILEYLPDNLPNYIGFSRKKLFVSLVDIS